MSTTLNRRGFVAASVAAATMPLIPGSASAQGAWPSRKNRMICSYPADGQTDLLARAFGEFISKLVGQTVVMENRAGASGSIGAAEVARVERSHNIMLDLDNLCDEQSRDQDARLRRGQGPDARQLHSSAAPLLLANSRSKGG